MNSYHFGGSYPNTRMRRMRHQSWRRTLHAENRLHPSDFIWPIIVRTPDSEASIPSMPGVKRFTLEELPQAVRDAYALGIRAVALFPQTPSLLKNESGSEAWNRDNLVCRAIQTLKNTCPEMGVIADVALDPYTSHGHDGVVIQGTVANDETIGALINQAIALAESGVDAIAPSDMMDGRVGVIRAEMDNEGYENVAIFSYGAKYASSLYGPFRNACGSGKSLGTADKKTYQMDPRNGKEAMRELALDVQEGADALIVKPGTFYLDIVKEASATFPIPIHAYHVSGECAMLKVAAEKGILDYNRALMENLIAFKRAGASVIWSYAALDAVRLLGDSSL